MGVLRAAVERQERQEWSNSVGYARSVGRTRRRQSESELDQQLDQLIDTDLMVGLPQQRSGDWFQRFEISDRSM